MTCKVHAYFATLFEETIHSTILLATHVGQIWVNGLHAVSLHQAARSRRGVLGAASQPSERALKERNPGTGWGCDMLHNI